MKVSTQLSLYAATLLTSLSIFSAKAQAADFCVDALGDEGREEICRIVNRERDQRNRDPLELDEELSEVAQAHANDMLKRKYFSHRAPNGSRVGTRLKAHRVDFNRAGENIARGQKTGPLVMRAWMNSSGHRANILRTSYGKIGIGRAGAYWVQVFTD